MPVDKLNLLKRAKEYMDCLAGGTDPVSGQPLSQEDPMGSERMRRCFAFVASTLEEVIAQRSGGETTVKRSAKALEEAKPAQVEKPKRAKRPEKTEFVIDPEALAEIPVSREPISYHEMACRLNTASGLENTDLNNTMLFAGLEAMGLLENRERAGGQRREPTRKGLEAGLTRIRFCNAAGQSYLANMLDTDGQQYVLEHLEEIVAQGRRVLAAREAEKALRKAEQKAEKAVRKAEEQAEKARLKAEEQAEKARLLLEAAKEEKKKLEQ